MTDALDLPYAIGKYGPAIIWHREVDGEFLEELKRLAAVEVRLWGAGLRPFGSIALLAEAPWLRGISLLPSRTLEREDWVAVESLEGLNYLHHGHDSASGHLDLTKTPELRWLSVPWWKGMSGLESLSLEGLSLRWWKGRGRSLEARAGLRVLALTGSDMTDLRPINHFKSLRSLEITHARRLNSISGIESLTELEEVQFESLSGLRDLSPLLACRGLRRVAIVDCKSLDRCDLSPLEKLEAIWLIGRTRVGDGKLRWLNHLSTLKLAVVGRMKHYDVDYDKLPTLPLEAAYSMPPDYPYRFPGIWEYDGLISCVYARKHLYPAWFRAAHPELCPD